MYKVFFVEDEIVTREGIRDNVNWKANGFEFCGEAMDGEMALSLLQTIRPDLLITDIKMPFMDGLQLCKIVRERMPRMKIIILSGHDEFIYAQKAIELGVTEYLLKPVTVQNIHRSLKKIATQLDLEHKEQEQLDQLHLHVLENRGVLIERLLLKLVVSAISSTEAIEQGRSLGLDLVARYYMVVILKAELNDRSEQFEYEEYRQIQDIVAARIGPNPDIFLLKKDWEELILIFKGGSLEVLEEERDQVLAGLNVDIQQTRYHFRVGYGSPKKRLAEIYHSFIEALTIVQTAAPADDTLRPPALEKTEILKIDKAAVENYLRSGTRDSFDEFFDAHIQPVANAALKSHLIKNYIMVDVVIAAAKIIKEWGGDIDQAIPEFASIDTILAGIKTVENLRQQVSKILLLALSYRELQTQPGHAKWIPRQKTMSSSIIWKPTCLSTRSLHWPTSAPAISARSLRVKPVKPLKII